MRPRWNPTETPRHIVTARSPAATATALHEKKRALPTSATAWISTHRSTLRLFSLVSPRSAPRIAPSMASSSFREEAIASALPAGSGPYFRDLRPWGGPTVHGVDSPPSTPGTDPRAAGRVAGP